MTILFYLVSTSEPELPCNELYLKQRVTPRMLNIFSEIVSSHDYHMALLNRAPSYVYGMTALWVDEGKRSRFLSILFSVASDLADRRVYISKGVVIGVSGLMLLLNWTKPAQTKGVISFKHGKHKSILEN